MNKEKLLAQVGIAAVLEIAKKTKQYIQDKMASKKKLDAYQEALKNENEAEQREAHKDFIK